jgi:2-iminoacetate synthase
MQILAPDTFSQRWEQLDMPAMQHKIQQISAADVERALSVTHIGQTEFMALISPAAGAYLEPLAQRAQLLSRQRFGNTVHFYVPLYLSNLCSNQCTYCGFSIGNKIKRKVLNAAEILAECEAIKALGFENLLLVTGEQDRRAGMAYFREVIPLIRPHFSSLMLEVQPLLQEEYAELKALGIDTVLVYQETYDAVTYAEHHLQGKKRDFLWRMQTADRLGRAGMDKIGLGNLLGLSVDWRLDSAILAQHLCYLRDTYWQSRFSLSFPRLRPCEGGIPPACIMTDAELVQLICAYRLLAPEVELSISTRESAHFRDHVIPLGINHVSAYSQTQPGGYANTERALEQFEINDGRRPEEVAQAIVRAGLQPVWKDWAAYLGR